MVCKIMQGSSRYARKAPFLQIAFSGRSKREVSTVMPILLDSVDPIYVAISVAEDFTLKLLCGASP